jgi:putative transposase
MIDHFSAFFRKHDDNAGCAKLARVGAASTLLRSVRQLDALQRRDGALRQRETRQNHPFTIEAMVVLPDHLHVVWTMPEGDADFATRWRLIKTGFSLRLPDGERISDSRAAKGERGIWQRRYWEHTIRDERDFAHHVDYIHINPVKHGLVARVQDWPYSSFHRMVKFGIYPEDWAGDASGHGDKFGERAPERMAR